MQPLHLHLGFGDQYGSAGLIDDFDRYPLVAELGGVVSKDARRSRGGLALHLLRLSHSTPSSSFQTSFPSRMWKKHFGIAENA
jgi:hypothetical protein